MLKRRQREPICIHTLNKGGAHLRKTDRLFKQNVFAQTSTQRTIDEGRITIQALGKFGLRGVMSVGRNHARMHDVVEEL